MKLLTRLLPFASFLPMIAFAQAPSTTYFTSWVTQISTFINTLIPVVLALALLLFLWGVFKYFVLGGGDEEKQAEGKKFMVYGLIGLVVMVAVWGIVQLIVTVLGVGNGTVPTVPKIPTGTP